MPKSTTWSLSNRRCWDMYIWMSLSMWCVECWCHGFHSAQLWNWQTNALFTHTHTQIILICSCLWLSMSASMSPSRSAADCSQCMSNNNAAVMAINYWMNRPLIGCIFLWCISVQLVVHFLLFDIHTSWTVEAFLQEDCNDFRYWHRILTEPSVCHRRALLIKVGYRKMWPWFEGLSCSGRDMSFRYWKAS